jgi:enoyl-CoA hydratase/carnithine racemase
VSAAGSCSTVWRVNYPTLALVRGHCLGGGLELALACRYLLAVDEPLDRMGLPEVMLGIVPGWGGMLRLPSGSARQAALDMMLTGKTIDAKRAKRLGLADDCVPPRVMERAARMLVLADQPRRRCRCCSGCSMVRSRQWLPARREKAGRQARAPRALSGAVRDHRHLGEAPGQCAGRPRTDRRHRSFADGAQSGARLLPAGAPQGFRQASSFKANACMSSAPA